MKKLSLLALSLFIGTMAMAIDCERSGSFVKPSDISIKGSVTLKYNSSNQLVIEFSSDFLTDAGPDLDVYLSSSSTKNSNSINVNALNSLSGAQSYIVTDPSVTLASHNYVIVHCTQYNHHYGYVMLGAQTGGDCASLGVEEKNEEFKAYYNNNQLVFTSTQNLNNVTLTVYNIQGSEVISLSSIALNQGKNDLPLAQLLQSGLYFLQINSGGKISVLKFYA